VAESRPQLDKVKPFLSLGFGATAMKSAGLAPSAGILTMAHFSALVVAAALTLFLQASAAVNTNVGYENVLYNPYIYANSSLLQQPQVIPYTLAGTLNVALTVQPYHFQNEIFGFTTRAYCLRGHCSVPGPTIRLRPGNKVRYVD
jgi:hypothetical protein